jgi:orotate phosphoribosyltransferase
LTIGEFELSSGQHAHYYVDAKRAVLTPEGSALVGRLTAAEAWRLGATSIAGLTMGADPVACAAQGAGANVNVFFVRKEKKAHGLQQWIEGPELSKPERCLVVDDVVTTGGSVVLAIKRLKDAGVEVVGVLTIVDRLAGARAAIDDATGGVPYRPLTTIDDVYPGRPDR